MGRIIGDFREYEEKVAIGEMSQEEYQKIFENARFHGLDDSVYPFAIGGSDASTIFGRNKYSTPVKLSRIKKGEYKEIRDDAQERILFIGHVFETPFRLLFSRETGIETYPYYKQTVHDEFPHCVANIDGLCVVNRELWIYEGKTTQSYNYRNLFRKGNVPPAYLLQVQFYMEVLDEIDEEVLLEVDPTLPSKLDSYEIKGAVVNCGWGIEPNEMAWSYVKRNKDIGYDICDVCESFVLDVEDGKIPSNENVIDVKILKEDEYANYGDIDKSLPPVRLKKEFLTPIKKAMLLEDSIAELEEITKKKQSEEKAFKEKMKEKYEEAEKTLKELQDKRDNLLLPIIDEVKSGTKAYLEDAGTVYKISYDGTTKARLNAATKKYWKEKYPECFEDIMNYNKYNDRKFTLEKEPNL